MNYFPNYFQPQPQQIQNGGFISVRNIEEAFNWPIAPGNSLTFKDESQPFVYTKTKGFSPLEQPTFERYKLVKVEEPVKPAETPIESSDSKEQIKQLWDEVNALKAAIKEQRHDQYADDEPVPAVHGKPGAVSKPDGYS